MGRFEFSVPTGRRRTNPVTLSTYSLRTSSLRLEETLADLDRKRLRQAFTITQIDEDHAAVITAADGFPTTQGNYLINVGALIYAFK